MRPRTQKQPQAKKELCRALDDVDVDVNAIYFLMLCVSSLMFSQSYVFHHS